MGGTITVCIDHGHILKEEDVTLAREIGRKWYDGEGTYRADESVWAWVLLRKNGSICHGYGSEPRYGKKQYMETGRDARKKT